MNIPNTYNFMLNVFIKITIKLHVKITTKKLIRAANVNLAPPHTLDKAR